MDLQKEARSIMQEIKGKYPDIGMQFCLMKKGKVIVNVNEGFASFDKSRNVDDSTLFPIYSTSKIVPGAAITKLIEEGVISPDQKVTDFWPEFGQNGKESTLSAICSITLQVFRSVSKPRQAMRLSATGKL